MCGGGGGFNLFAVDQTSPLVLPWFLRHLVFWFAWKIPNSIQLLLQLKIHTLYAKLTKEHSCNSVIGTTAFLKKVSRFSTFSLKADDAFKLL